MKDAMPKPKRTDSQPQVVIAPMSEITRIKERIDRNGQVIEKKVEEPRKK